MYIKPQEGIYTPLFFEVGIIVPANVTLAMSLRPLFEYNDLRTDELIELNYTPWSESASELYRPSDRRLSAK
jgi:hypothetical protein